VTTPRVNQQLLAILVADLAGYLQLLEDADHNHLTACECQGKCGTLGAMNFHQRIQ